MKRKQGKDVRRKRRRSTDQREWNAAVGRASGAWEYLSDGQRLLWNVAAKTCRMSGQRYFVKINARRLWNGLELLTEPPALGRYDSKRVLKRLVITNRRGRITLELEVSLVRGARYTVWGSLPCNLGISRCYNCPRLGALPPPAGGWSDITALYFRKHGAYIMEHEMPVVGKRIYIRVRQERDDGPALYEEVREVVPVPEGEGEQARSGLFIWNLYGAKSERPASNEIAKRRQSVNTAPTACEECHCKAQGGLETAEQGGVGKGHEWSSSAEARPV